MKKKIGLGLIAVLVIIQFVRPTRNISTGESPNEISKYYEVPADIHAVVKKSCYDCHSNTPWTTRYMPYKATKGKIVIEWSLRPD